VLRVLAYRFGADAEIARPLVEQVSALDALEVLHEAALEAADMQAFIEQARAYLPPQS
jgi:hypothetical protein